MEAGTAGGRLRLRPQGFHMLPSMTQQTTREKRPYCVPRVETPY
ncbi:MULTISPECIES: hypothetical protein [Kribbella]|nr:MULTISPECIES: hypothetical protein [Kribbella]